MNQTRACPVCGGGNFTYNEELWSELIDDWELKPHEVDYINRQQGFICSECGNNLRSMALADAILKRFQFKTTLREFVKSEIASPLRVLEINEAGGLTPFLSQIPGHVLVQYPEYDMVGLPFDRKSFDLVLHSDTLEHVEDPVQGLEQCRALLRPTGACIYTVPIVVGRLSRSRQGLKPSYHGEAGQKTEDFMVHTEFGSDMWVTASKAGFRNIRISCYEFPAAIAIEANLE